MLHSHTGQSVARWCGRPERYYRLGRTRAWRESVLSFRWHEPAPYVGGCWWMNPHVPCGTERASGFQGRERFSGFGSSFPASNTVLARQRGRQLSLTLLPVACGTTPVDRSAFATVWVGSRTLRQQQAPFGRRARRRHRGPPPPPLPRRPWRRTPAGSAAPLESRPASARAPGTRAAPPPATPATP